MIVAVMMTMVVVIVMVVIKMMIRVVIVMKYFIVLRCTAQSSLKLYFFLNYKHRDSV